MGERRKPKYVLLLKNLSNNKTSKVELFDRTLFTKEPLPKKCRKKQYRLRVNGKWFPKNSKPRFFASWQIRDLFWGGLPF